MQFLKKKLLSPSLLVAVDRCRGRTLYSTLGLAPTGRAEHATPRALQASSQPAAAAKSAKKSHRIMKSMLRRLLVYMRMLKIGALAYCCVGAGQVARLWLHPMDAAGTASPLKAADFADVDSKWLQLCQQKYVAF